MAESNIESKIRKLLALATDPATTEEERRTSAVLAAELMKEHEFAPRPTISKTPPNAGPRPDTSPVAPPKQAAPAESASTHQSTIDRLIRDARRAEAAKSPLQRQLEKEDAARAEQNRQVATAAFRVGEAWGQALRKKP